MKKIKAIILLMMLFVVSGCVKYDVGMTVGPDKSFTIDIITAVPESLEADMTVDEDMAALEAKGYTYKEYNEEGWVGYRFNKQYANIDDVSVNYELTVELSDLLDPEKDTKVFFQKKTSLFTTTYIAHFTIDLMEEDNSSLPTESENEIITDDTMDTLFNYDALSGAELNYRVSLPVKSANANATDISADGRNLTWELEYGIVNKIDYEFSIINNTVYYIGGGIILLGVMMMLSGFISNRKNKKRLKIEEAEKNAENAEDGVSNLEAIGGPIELGSVPVNNANMPVVEPNIGEQNNEVMPNNIEMPVNNGNVQTEEKPVLEAPNNIFGSVPPIVSNSFENAKEVKVEEKPMSEVSNNIFGSVPPIVNSSFENAEEVKIEEKAIPEVPNNIFGSVPLIVNNSFENAEEVKIEEKPMPEMPNNIFGSVPPIVNNSFENAEEVKIEEKTTEVNTNSFGIKIEEEKQEDKGQSGHIPFTGFNVGYKMDETNKDEGENKM